MNLRDMWYYKSDFHWRIFFNSKSFLDEIKSDGLRNSQKLTKCGRFGTLPNCPKWSIAYEAVH